MKLISILIFLALLIIAINTKAEGPKHINLQNLDKNGDGSITFEEFSSKQLSKLKERFSKLDKDQSGSIDQHEIEKIKHKRKRYKNLRDLRTQDD